MNSCVSMTRVGKRFGTQWVFRELSVELPSGETTAIVGASGSGKTTLLQLVNGIYEADEGEVLVMGEPIPKSGIHAFRRRIGYSVQGAGLFPHMTIDENVGLVARLEGWQADEIAGRAKELFRFMDLDASLGGRYPHQLSGGQQQRVGLCRAMMLQPEMLLLDEPFSAIDPITKTDIHRQFKALQSHESVSTLLVTHDLREAVHLASYLVIMDSGSVAQADVTAAVLDAPQPGYVADLLASQL